MIIDLKRSIDLRIACTQTPFFLIYKIVLSVFNITPHSHLDSDNKKRQQGQYLGIVKVKKGNAGNAVYFDDKNNMQLQ